MLPFCREGLNVGKAAVDLAVGDFSTIATGVAFDFGILIELALLVALQRDAVTCGPANQLCVQGEVSRHGGCSRLAAEIA